MAELREHSAKETPLATVEEALGLRNESKEANQEILALGSAASERTATPILMPVYAQPTKATSIAPIPILASSVSRYRPDFCPLLCSASTGT